MVRSTCHRLWRRRAGRGRRQPPTSHRVGERDAAAQLALPAALLRRRDATAAKRGYRGGPGGYAFPSRRSHCDTLGSVSTTATGAGECRGSRVGRSLCPEGTHRSKQFAAVFRWSYAGHGRGGAHGYGRGTDARPTLRNRFRAIAGRNRCFASHPRAFSNCDRCGSAGHQQRGNFCRWPAVGSRGSRSSRSRLECV